MKKILGFILILCLTSCVPYMSTLNEGLSTIVIRPNTNMTFKADSIALELLPLKNKYVTLYQGQQVVVAEIDIFPDEGADSLQLKLIHDEKIQGWLPQRYILHNFESDDSISHIISWIYNIPLYVSWILGGLFIILCLCFYYKKKPVHFVFINNINSIYPMLLCLVVATATTLFVTILKNEPDSWFHYRFNPTLSPFDVSGLFTAFLISMWLLVIIAFAAVDDIIREFSFGNILFNILGLIVACLLSYYAFYYAGIYSFGYYLLAGMFVWFIICSYKILRNKYSCGRCGTKMSSKGVCPGCGAVNE